MICFHCQKEIPIIDQKVSFREECPACRSDAHVCKNCEFYDPKVYNECKETSADVVREKERANYCDFFQPSGRGQKTGPSKEDLRAKAEALFKKG